jgi:hypothetical protein
MRQGKRANSQRRRSNLGATFMLTTRLATVVLLGAAASALASAPSRAQGYGEQAPLQFKYANQGLTNEVYRLQLGAAAAAAAASSSSGGLGGNGQQSSNLNNAIQVYNNQTYNVTMSGSNDVLNVSGDTINAQQSSSGTKQTNTNTKDSNIPANIKSLGAGFLNK